MFFFLRFLKDILLRQQWVRACRRVDPDNPLNNIWTPGEFTYLCSKHFCDSDFLITSTRKCLRQTAIPSKFSFNKEKEVSSRERRYSDSYLTLSAHVTPTLTPDTLLSNRNKHLRDKLRNSGKREKRLRLSVENMTKELEEYKLLTADLKEKLKYFKGNLYMTSVNIIF